METKDLDVRHTHPPRVVTEPAGLRGCRARPLSAENRLRRRRHHRRPGPSGGETGQSVADHRFPSHLGHKGCPVDGESHSVAALRLPLRPQAGSWDRGCSSNACSVVKIIRRRRTGHRLLSDAHSHPLKPKRTTFINCKHDSGVRETSRRKVETRVSGRVETVLSPRRTRWP